VVEEDPPPLEEIRADTEALAIPLELNDDDTGPVAIQVDRLVCVAGPDMGRTFPVGAEAVVIGRDAQIVLHASDVSRRHARVSVVAGHLAIEDLGSANGTFLNGARVTGKQKLEVGDRIRLGSTLLVLSRHDELQERLQQLQKVETMNALVKGLAHDFNNVLTVLQAGLEELAAPRLALETRLSTVEDMRHATESAAALVRRLLRVGRNKPETSQLVGLDSLIDEVKPMLKRVLPTTIDLMFDGVTMAMVRGSRDELRQVLLNLVLNARDAMPDGGRITISSSVQTLDRASALAKHLPHEGAYVHISVRDSGHGMDEATLARIFEPYFTTKPAGKGNGLGLAMVFSTIRNHQGSIWAESVLRRGTVFRILLPLAA
jgi:signal transduction histidine kinase